MGVASDGWIIAASPRPPARPLTTGCPGETTGRIEDLIPRQAITSWTRLVLANAVFFRAKWQLPFDERATSRAPFHSLDGEESRVEMMRQTGDFGFARGDGYEGTPNG